MLFRTKEKGGAGEGETPEGNAQGNLPSLVGTGNL